MKEKSQLFQSRIKHIQNRFPTLRVDAVLISQLSNVRYLTDFTGSNAQLLITKDRLFFLTDGRYDEQAHKEVSNAKIIITSKRSLTEEIARRNLLKSVQQLGFEKDHIAYAHYRLAMKTFSSQRLKGLSNLVEEFRLIKSEDEIRVIKKAIEITDLVFKKILNIIHPGVRENEIAAEISYQHKLHGAESDAFEQIVLSGKRTSLIHGKPDSTLVKNGDLVLLDIGCRYDGYHSDVTRTIAVGKINHRMKKIYEIVKDTQQRAIDESRAGVRAKNVDRAARKHFTSFALQKYFSHSTGHGIGLDVHEQPRISSNSTHVLQNGNVITIEPGIYIPNVGGIRIEDDVVIQDDGCVVLNASPRQLIVL